MIGKEGTFNDDDGDLALDLYIDSRNSCEVRNFCSLRKIMYISLVLSILCNGISNKFHSWWLEESYRNIFSYSTTFILLVLLPLSSV